MIEHRCRECNAPAAWGFGYSVRFEMPGTWYCARHKALGEEIPVFTEDEYLKQVPGRFIGTCAFCNRALDTREQGSHQWTSGWVKVREAGGGHGISLPVREDKWAHGHCVEKRIKGLEKQQALTFR